ncbi:PepSY domain-containing protein [Marinobacteraceae bacterium S3BR75-40.1]
MKKGLSIAVLVSVMSAAPVFAGEMCDVPSDQWQPEATVQAALEKKGWTVKRLAKEDGCYEAYALDEKGERVEAYINPQTLELVKVKRDD